MSGSRIWTPDRNAFLRIAYPAGISTATIQKTINGMQGEFVPFKRIAIQAGSMGLKRPPGFTYNWRHVRQDDPGQTLWAASLQRKVVEVARLSATVPPRPVGPPFSMLGGTLGLRR